MNIPSLDKTESLLVIGVVGFLVYLGYKAKQGADAVGDRVMRAYNDIGDTVRNTADNARNNAQTALGATFNPGGTAASQLAQWWNEHHADIINPDDLAYWESQYEQAPPDQPDDLYKRMQKPSYERLSQPLSRYPK